MVHLTPLGVAVAPADPLSGASVSPMAGIVGSGGDVEVVVNGCVGGIT